MLEKDQPEKKKKPSSRHVLMAGVVAGVLLGPANWYYILAKPAEPWLIEQSLILEILIANALQVVLAFLGAAVGAALVGSFIEDIIDLFGINLLKIYFGDKWLMWLGAILGAWSCILPFLLV